MKTNHKTLTAFLALGTLLGAAPNKATAQLPTERPVAILCPQTLPPTLNAAVFGTRLSSEQDFVAMPGHPQTYRLDLFGRPLRQLYIGGNVAHSGSGLQRKLSGEIDLAADLAIAPAWRFFGGIAAGIDYFYYKHDGIVTEHPFYDQALDYSRLRYTVGAMTDFTYEMQGGRHFGFGTRADLAIDDRTLGTRSYIFYESASPDQTKAACRTYFVHHFYSHLQTKHYYKAGCRLSLFQSRLALDAAYEASADVQTAAVGLSIGLCKGLALSYDLSLPFRFNGRQAGAAVHTLAITYRLQRQPPETPAQTDEIETLNNEYIYSF